jgi:hypothetical protein
MSYYNIKSYSSFIKMHNNFFPYNYQIFIYLKYILIHKIRQINFLK